MDGSQRSALATTRSLGRTGASVCVADVIARPLAARSRYCASVERYPDPRDTSTFVAGIEALTARYPGVPLLACSDATLAPLLDAGVPARVPMCAPPVAAYHRLSDKWSLYRLARELAVPTPTTWCVRAGDPLASEVAAGSTRVVVKPRASVLEVDGERLRLPVLLLDRAALAAVVEGTSYPRSAELLVQERISGEGVGVSTVCANGVPLRWFAHRRLREKPPSGGVSTLCESIPLPPLAREYCERLVAAVGWHGPAMFEFKRDERGDMHLIEVNGRLWGSLQLAIEAGVDVPDVMLRLARGERVVADAGYRIGARMRWLAGDTSYLYLMLRGRSADARFANRWAALASFLTPRANSVVEDWRYGDLAPAWSLLRQEWCA